MTTKMLKAAMSAIILGVILTACGVSQEKIDEAHTAIETMKKAKEETEASYLDITDSSRKNELDILAKEAEKYEATDVEKLGGKIEDFISDVSELTQSYQSINNQFSYIKNQEALDKEEKAKHSYYNVYIQNKTGKNLDSIKLRDVVAEVSSDNFLGDDVTLQDGYILMGCQIDIYADSAEWIFILEDDEGGEHFLSCENLKGKNLEGKTFVLSIDPNSGEKTATISQ